MLATIYVFNLFLRACSAKKRRLTLEAEAVFTESSCSDPRFDWPSVNSCPPPQLDPPGSLSPVVSPKNQHLLQPLCVLSRPETDGSCMEVEAAQRKLQEIENRCEIDASRNCSVTKCDFFH